MTRTWSALTGALMLMWTSTSAARQTAAAANPFLPGVLLKSAPVWVGAAQCRPSDDAGTTRVQAARSHPARDFSSSHVGGRFSVFGLRIVGGFRPSTNAAAQAGSLDPVWAESFSASGPGEVERLRTPPDKGADTGGSFGPTCRQRPGIRS